MPDNTPIVDANSVTEDIATDELVTLNGVDVSTASPRIKAQRVKVVFGSPTAATDVDATHGLPVVLESAIPAGTNVIGHVVVDTAPTTAVTASDGAVATVGTTTDAEAASGNGTLVAILKRIRTLLSGGLPAALGSSGGLKVENVAALPAGANTIGTVNVGTMPAAARTTDSISSALATDAIMSNLTALTPKFAKITASAAGATTIVAAVASKKIRVLKWDLVANGAVNVKWQSHVTPTDETGLYYLAANGGIASGFSPVGHFETVAGEALDVNLSGAVAVGGVLTYVEV